MFRFQFIKSFLSSRHSGLDLFNFRLKILNLLVEAFDRIKNFGNAAIFGTLDIFFIVVKSILETGNLCLELMEKWFFAL